MLPTPPLLRLSAALSLAPACVLPLDPLTGVEVAWTLREREASDGDAARRLRTCAGAGVEGVVLHVEDRGDPARARTFEFACPSGDQPPDELAVAAARIFLDLRPGDYTLRFTATGSFGAAESVHELTVEERGVDLLSPDLAPELVPLALTLALAPATCAQLRLRLRLADPAAALHAHADADADAPPPGLYRAGLTSDRGLSLGGAAHPCADPELLGLHTFEVDPGDYRLEIELDEARCEVPLRAAPGWPPLALDLENPPCDG